MALSCDFPSDGTLYGLFGLEAEERADSGLWLKLRANPQNLIQEENRSSTIEVCLMAMSSRIYLGSISMT